MRFHEACLLATNLTVIASCLYYCLATGWPKGPMLQ